MEGGGSTAKGGRQSYPSSYCRKSPRSTAILCKRLLRLSPAPRQAARARRWTRCTMRCPSRRTQEGSKMTRATSRRMCDNPQPGRHWRNSKMVHPPRRRHPGWSRGSEEDEKKTSCQRRRPTDHLRPGRTRAGEIGQAVVRDSVECQQLSWVHVCNDGDSEMPGLGGWQLHSI